MYDVVEANNVNVLEFLHEGDFANRSGWRSFLGVEMDLLQGHNLISSP